jgi:NAD(P)-dependent dehydrogenase (short-subunit alcohol dehydrogenase family)
MADILITGASTGIGEATALHLDQLGHRVFAGVRKDADGERLVEQAGSGRLMPVTLDVTDDDQVTEALGLVADETDGRLDGVVNNAGLAIGGPVEFIPLSDFRRQMDVNVTGLLAVTQAAMPLIRAGGGRVVLVGSVSGRVAVPMTGAYSASKFAVEALADTLRMELRRWNIQVVLIQPGAVKTSIWDKGRAQAAAMRDNYPTAALDLYTDEIDKVVTNLDAQDEAGVPPLRVAEKIEKALFARRPSPRYGVGTDAAAGKVLARILPDRVKDVVVAKVAGP